MNGFTELISNPYAYACLALYWAFNNAVEALPTPTETSSVRYTWLYKFLNGFAGNMREAVGTKMPSTPKKDA